MKLAICLLIALFALSGTAGKISVNDDINSLLKKRLNDKVVKTLHLASQLSGYVDDNELDDLHQFLRYIAKYNRQYSNPAEVRQKFKAVQSALKSIKMLNKKNPLAEFGLTERSDRPRKHRKRRHDMDQFARNSDPLPKFPTNSTPDTYDWRVYGGVTSVKRQGDCEGSYVFAAVAAVESQWLIHIQKGYIDLSETEVLSCTYNNSKYESCEGCLGGEPSDALSYIKDHGITDETLVPYDDHAVFRFCMNSTVVARVNATKSLQNVDEEELRSIVYNIGPVVVTVQAEVIEHYMKGIISLQQKEYFPDHSLLLVGYGEENGRKYWILKNSWGQHYGEDGYLRVERGFNVIGIAEKVDIAII